MAKSMPVQKTCVVSYACFYYSYWRSYYIETVQPPATRTGDVISVAKRVGSYSKMEISFQYIAALHSTGKWWYPRVQRWLTGDWGRLCPLLLHFLLLSC